MASLQAEKQALRAAARARRQAAAQAGAGADMALAGVFRRDVPLRPAAVIAGYLPIGDEIDPRPLMRLLQGDGHPLALPRVARMGAPLVFAEWRDGDALEPGPFGTLQPPEAAGTAVPDALIVPLLAFDRRGYRLGYGGGYYDRTLAVLRGRRAVAAIGVAYAAQEVPSVPHDRRDQRLDWIVTEQGAINTGSGD